MTAQTGDLLFVYGTLQTVAQHPMGDLLRRHARLVGEGSICARLYIIDDPEDPGANYFPGAMPSPEPTDRVYGEIYEVVDPAPLMPQLDRLEACSDDWPEPHEFLLRSVEVQREGASSIRAWCYLYTWDVTGAERITMGRFTEIAPDVR